MATSIGEINVEVAEKMVRDLQQTRVRQAQILRDTDGKLELARRMLDAARSNAAQKDLVGKASTPGK